MARFIDKRNQSKTVNHHATNENVQIPFLDNLEPYQLLKIKDKLENHINKSHQKDTTKTRKIRIKCLKGKKY